MKTTAQLLDEARSNLAKSGKTPSYYRLAREIGITDQRMNTHAKRGLVWSDELALKTSPFLNYPAEVLLLWARMEREKNPEVMAVLERMEQRLSA